MLKPFFENLYKTLLASKNRIITPLIPTTPYHQRLEGFVFVHLSAL